MPVAEDAAPTKTQDAVFVYRCRACSGESLGPYTGLKQANIALSMALGGNPGPGIPLTLTSVHPHPDGSAGVSDLVGYRVYP